MKLTNIKESEYQYIKSFVLSAREHGYTWKQIENGLKDDDSHLFEFLIEKVELVLWTEKVLLPYVYKAIIKMIRKEVENNGK